MKNENKPEYLTADELCKLNPIERAKYKAVCGALYTGGFQELTPDQIETYKKSHVTAAIRYKLKQPASSPESKEVESAPVKSAEEILNKISCIDNDELQEVEFEFISVNYVTAIEAMETYASQFKTNPIEVIKMKIALFSKEDYKGYKREIDVLRNILKLIQ